MSTSKLVWFGQDAQPRKLSAAGSVLSWEAPCTALERPLQYTILLRDTVTGKETYASLAPTKDVSLRYTVENLQVQRLTVRVQKRLQILAGIKINNSERPASM